MSRQIDSQEITGLVASLLAEANFDLSSDVLQALDIAKESEESPLGREVLSAMSKNAEVARKEQIPICQDTGLAVVFIEMGQAVRLLGEPIVDAVNNGVKKAHKEAGLRASVVSDPLFARRNTGDNTPAVVHTDVVPGDVFKITVLIKGGGSESVGSAKVIKPADGVEGVKEFVMDVVREAGPNPCPPIFVGIGCGGTLDYAGYLAKKALLRPVGQKNENQKIADLEEEILENVNELGIGPSGMGGRHTALGVSIETYPSHIATLPVSIDISCYALRRKSAAL